MRSMADRLRELHRTATTDHPVDLDVLLKALLKAANEIDRLEQLSAALHEELDNHETVIAVSGTDEC